MAPALPLTSPAHAALYRQLGLWPDKTITETFVEAAERHGSKTAIIEKNRRFTYDEFRQRIDCVAGNLLDFDLPPGQVIALQSKNASEIPLMHLACNRLGLLFMPLHDGWRETELKHLLSKTRAPLLIVPTEYRGFDYATMIAGIREDLPDLKYLFTLDGQRPGFKPFSELLEAPRHSVEDLSKHRPLPDLPAHIMLSGGTTSLSKVARFSSNDLLAMLKTFSTAIELTDDDIVAALAPAGTGATGYVFPILAPLLHGGTSVILERWGAPEEAIDLIIDQKCTCAVGIPTQLTRMIPELEKRRLDEFGHLRAFFNSGAALPFETGLQIEKLTGCVSLSMYGATDGGAPVITTVRDTQDKRIGTVGKVAIGFECQLWDPTGDPVPVDESGEVVWRGPDKSWGYLGDDEQTAAAFTKAHFYKSGDLGQFDSEGYLRIVGRVKDMILRGGRNIFPRTTEELLMKHPGIVEVSVAAMPDRELGERACAFVVLRKGASLDFDGMIKFLKDQKLAVWQLPERLEILDDLPRGPGGKILKTQLTNMVAEKLKVEGRALRQ